jgi:four helix bundle protein
MNYKNFEDLPVWKLSLKITKIIYDLTSKQKFSKDFKLRDQIKGAIISVSSNIVEGFEKNNNNEFVRYLKIAKGSAGEVRNQLHIALTVDYITEEEFTDVSELLGELTKQIGGLIKYLQVFKNKKSVIRNP